jgi:hypothetical protein
MQRNLLDGNPSRNYHAELHPEAQRCVNFESWLSEPSSLAPIDASPPKILIALLFDQSKGRLSDSLAPGVGAPVLDSPKLVLS